MLDKIMVGVGQSVTMDTAQIMIFLVHLILTYERTILRTTTDFFYFSYELFLCIIMEGEIFCGFVNFAASWINFLQITEVLH